MSNTKININGGLLTYIGWFLATLPAVISVGPYGIGFIDLLKSTFNNTSSQTAETFLATVFLNTIGFVASLVIYQFIILILCPLLVFILLRDYPQRRISTIIWLFILLFVSPAWLIIGFLTSAQLLGVGLALIWSILSPYIAWRLSDRKIVPV